MTFVVVPYRYGSTGPRLHNMLRVVEHLKGTGLRKHVAGAEPWSPGAARNNGARMEPQAEVYVFNDADTVCPHEQIATAVKLAREAPGLVYAYDLYVRKTEDGRDGETIFNAPSMGCVAISGPCFRELGGFDDSYVGWGYEDLEFANRAAQRWPLRRVPGPVWHLWHGERRDDDAPEDSDPLEVLRNLERWSSRTASTA